MTKKALSEMTYEERMADTRSLFLTFSSVWT